MGQARCKTLNMGQRVGRFQCGYDAFQLAAQLKRFQRFIVGRRYVIDPANIMQPSMFRADPWVIQPGGYGMGFRDLAVIVLQEVSPVAVQNARPAGSERGGVPAGLNAVAGGFDGMNMNVFLIEKFVK